QTVRIPLRDFPGFATALGTQVHGIRLTFDQTSSGAIYVANIRLSNFLVTSGPVQDTGNPEDEVKPSEGTAIPPVLPYSGVITMLRRLPAVPQLGNSPGVEIEI